MTPPTNSRIDSPPSLEDHLRRSIAELRGALTTLLASASLNDAAPLDLARRLGIHKNLAWKIHKIVRSTEPFGSVQHLPGQSGLSIFVQAAEREGASKDAISGVRRAMRAFDLMIREHCGDRATLELFLDGLGDENGHTLAKSRKLGFQANSGVFGLQAQVMLTAFFVAPSATEGRLDEIVVGGMLGLRRLRSDSTWPLMQSYFGLNYDTPAPTESKVEAIDPAFAKSDGPKFIGDFCTPNLPEIHALPIERGTRYEFAHGQVGNKGTFDFFTGEIIRESSPRWPDETNQVLEFQANVRVPVKSLMVDLISHESLGFMSSPRHLLVNLLHPDARYHHRRQATDRIPGDESAQDIGLGPPIFSTPLWPRYDELVSRVFERSGWDPREFRASRVVLEYPPLPAASVLQVRLPEKPE